MPAGVAALAVLLGGSGAALAGAWTLPPGGSEFWSTTSIAGAGSAFGPGYALGDGANYRKVEQNLLWEYGALDGVTLLFGTQFLAVTITGPERAQYAGPGYSDAGARFRLAAGAGWVVSAQAVARAPGAGGSSSRAALGYQDWEADLRLMAGLSFVLLGLPAFLDLQLAQRQRLGDPPDELRFDATLGAEVAPGWLLLAQSFNVLSEGAGEGPDFDLSYDYYKAQIATLVEVDGHLSVGVAAFTTYLARNFPQENGLVFAARYRF
ncbi:hypothetical protein [Azorhizobium doebereinerae]|uniref:hypothetical protein n=1 Tax=Azorhizobium doebereinerae TaxID=281091 RepID=UPI000404A9E8|nr:hypothetical protein [Azorhizobium doebereinerae]